jgi:hypothetical protein
MERVVDLHLMFLLNYVFECLASTFRVLPVLPVA